MSEAERELAVEIRALRGGDIGDVIRIDAQHTGESKSDYWAGVLPGFLPPVTGTLRVGLAAELDSMLVGYLLGEVRAFEFGSEACGWIFAVGVEREHLHGGIASALLDTACRRFKENGIDRVRTMVRRNDVEVMSFFRSNGFVGGSFVQLERDVEGDE